MSNKNNTTMLSKHFSLKEMTYSQIAVENALDNTPPPAARQALNYLATHLLEPLRVLYGKPIAILSGFRSEAVNHLAGGVSSSQHRKGEAADCYTPDATGLLNMLKRSGLLFDQAILYRKRNFLHLSLKADGGNRMQVLFYLFCLVFILSGCGARKKSEHSESFRMASVLIEKRDTMSRYSHLFATDSLNWKIGEVALSVPDSAGYQYPERITVLQAGRYSTFLDTSRVIETKNSAISQSQSESASFSGSQEKTPSYGNWVLWIAVVLLIVVGGISIRYM